MNKIISCLQTNCFKFQLENGLIGQLHYSTVTDFAKLRG